MRNGARLLALRLIVCVSSIYIVSCPNPGLPFIHLRTRLPSVSQNSISSRHYIGLQFTKLGLHRLTACPLYVKRLPFLLAGVGKNRPVLTCYCFLSHIILITTTLIVQSKLLWRNTLSYSCRFVPLMW